MAGKIDPNKILPEIKDLDKALQNMAKTLFGLDESLVKLSKDIDTYQTSQKNTITSTNKIKEANEKLTRTEIELQKVEKKTVDLIFQREAEQSKQFKTQERIRQDRKAQNQELKKEIELERAINKATKTVSGSYNEIQKQLKENLIRYKALTKEQRDNVNIGGKLQATIKNQTNTLKNLDKGLGNAQRNVGNYGDAFSSLPGPIGNATSAMKRFSQILKLILLNPIVLAITAVVGALVALGKAFTSTDSGATELAAKFRQLKAIMDLIRQAILDVGEAFAILFDKSKTWKERMAELNNLMDDNAEKWKNGVKGAADYERQLDSLNDAETRYISQASVNRKLIAQLEYRAQDRNLSTAERRKALLEAISIGESELKKQQEFAKKRFDIEVEYYANLYNISSDSIKQLIAADDEQALELIQNDEKLAKFRNELSKGDERIKNLEEFYSKAIDLETSYFTEQKRNISRLSGFDLELQKGRADIGKESDAITKKNLSEAEKAFSQFNKDVLADLDETLKEAGDKELEAATKAIDLVNTVDYKRKQAHEEELERIQERISVTAQAGQQIFAIGNQLRESERIEAENQFQESISRIEEQARRGIISEQQAADRKLIIQNKLDKEIAEINRKQAVSDKLGAIFNASINTAQGITAALAVTNIPLSIIIGLLGAAQIAAIAQTPIPKFAEGVIDKSTDGLGWVGEGKFSELVKTPDGKAQIVDKATLMYLPKHSDVIPITDNKIDFKGGVTDEKMDQLINEVKKGNNNKTQHIDTGYMYKIKKNREITNYVDVYYKGLN